MRNVVLPAALAGVPSVCASASSESGHISDKGMAWKRWAIACLAGLLLAFCQLSHADGTFIDAPGRVDMVNDAARGLVYITSGDRVLRYNIVSASFLEPIVLGGSLKGVALSPDGNTLAVADDSWDDNVMWLHLVNLDTLVDDKVTIPKDPFSFDGTYGTYAVAFDRSGGLLVSSRFSGSGSMPLRRLDTASMTWEVLLDLVTQDSMLAASGDGRTVGFAEANISDGRWGVYSGAGGWIAHRDWYENGTSDFNYEIGVNGTGTQFAILAWNGTKIYDANYQNIARLGSGASGPIGVGYHPVEQQAFFPWSGTREVRVYDMRTFALLGSYDFEDDFEPVGFAAYVQGRTRLSADGSLLMVSVTGGVRFVRMYSPLSADDLSVDTTGRRVTILLKGHIGNDGALTYGLQIPPAHGKVFIAGDTATYLPAPGYSGKDSFTYAAHYGLAVANATVTLDVTADESAYAPVVSFDTLPVLQSTTPVPSSGRVPGDFNGDRVSDLLWFNTQQSQLGYWTMVPKVVKTTTDNEGSTSISPSVRRTGARTFDITAGYLVGAVGDFNGDGYADLMFTSPARDMWLWTNSRTGGWRSERSYDYPVQWQLVGAGDVDGDGKDDLLWLNPSECKFAYWLMNGPVRKGSRTFDVACGYYLIGLGYYTPTNRLSLLWSSANNDLYVWDSQGSGFRSYDLTGAMQVGDEPLGLNGIWALGGGYAGNGIGLEWNAQNRRSGAGASLTRMFDAQGNQTGYQTTPKWTGGLWMDNPKAAAYLIQGGPTPSTGLYALDVDASKIEASGLPTTDATTSGNAPRALRTEWSYPAGWYPVGAPDSIGIPLPWR